AILKRLGEDRKPPYQQPVLSWELSGSPGGGILMDLAPGTGIYLGEYRPAITAASLQLAELRLGSVVFGKTGVLQVKPGRASDLNPPSLHSEAPPRSTSGLQNQVPADGATVVNVVIENLRDVFGNLIREGVVTWGLVEDEPGEVLVAQTPIVDGKSVTQYRAGIEKGPITIIAQVDEKEFPLVIQQVPLTITMSQEGNRIRATVDS